MSALNVQLKPRLEFPVEAFQCMHMESEILNDPYPFPVEAFQFMHMESEILDDPHAFQDEAFPDGLTV